MLRIKLLFSLLLTTFLVLFSASLSVCHGDFSIYYRPTIHNPGLIKLGDHGVASWEMKRRVPLDGDGVEFAANESLILAAKRTRRKDPLDNFRYYEGGWNISEKHYFSSVAYSAAPLFIIAVTWFLGFAVVLLVICIRHCCCQLRNYGYSRTAYALSFIFLIFFTMAAIAGCIVLYTGQEKFHSSTRSTLKYVVNQADATIDNLTTLSDYLSAAKGIGVDQISLQPSIQNNINKVENMINASTITLQNETDKNSDRIRKALASVRLTLITVAAVMIILVFLGFLLSIFGMQSVVYTLAVIGWILATIALILCILFLILHYVVGDTCVSMEEWVQNPTAHTALDDILPCVDNATAQETLHQSKDVTFQLVGVVNTFITTVSNINPPPNLPPNLPPNIKRLYYNQSGPLVPVLCSPFNSDKTDRSCAASEVDFSKASQEWRRYICQVSANGTCTTTGRLTPEYYNQMMSVVNVSYTLHHYGPFLVGLEDCTFVRETFSGITGDHCPSLNRHSEWIFVGLMMVSAAVMLSLIFWASYARERRHRVCTKQFINLSAQESIREANGVKSNES